MHFLNFVPQNYSFFKKLLSPKRTLLIGQCVECLTQSSINKLLFRSAHDDGWLFKVKLSDKTELEGLMPESKYEEYLKTQEEDGH